MKRSIRSARGALALSALCLAVSCEPPDAETIDLETLRVQLWQPEELSTGASGDLLEGVENVGVVLFIDGEKKDFSLRADSLKALQAAAADGSEVRVELRTSGGALPDAIARTPPIRLEPGAGVKETVAVLAPPDELHTLSRTLPLHRREPGVCAAPDGRVWIASGADGSGTPATGTFLLDPRARQVAAGPGLSARRAPDCTWDGDGGVYVFGGCDASNGGTFRLLRSAEGHKDSPFADVGEHVIDGGCGSRVRRAPSGELFVVEGGVVQVLSADGATDVALKLLDTPRYHAQALALPGSSPRLLLVGGYDWPTAGAPVSGAVLLTLSGNTLEVQTRPDLTGIVLDAGGAAFGIRNGTVVALSEGGSASAVSGIPPLSGVSVSSFVRLGDDVFAALTSDGTRVHLLTKQGNRALDVDPPRPGAHLVADPGGALLVIGGGDSDEVTGVLVLTTDPSAE